MYTALNRGCNSRKPLLLAVLMLSFVLQGCENNPVGSEGWDHVPAVGYELEMDGKVLVSYFMREFTFDPSGELGDYVLLDDEIYSGSFFVGGLVRFQEHHLDPESGKTPKLTIFFLDEHRQRLDIPEYYKNGARNPDAEWKLEFQSFHPRCREQQFKPEERPFDVLYDATHETWNFRLQKRSQGEAGIRINLFHLDHYDMTSIPLPVKLN
ncbi:hypothetical protein QLX67_09560 [Balneolaceae bacterium ANBcel3]|nr:hypothetical protein [Balneolaceae bacterium ANBcel3]